MKLIAIIIYIFLFISSSVCLFITAAFTDKIIDFTQTLFQIEDKPINGHLIVLFFYSIVLGISYLIISGQKKYAFFYNYPILDSGILLLARLMFFLSQIFIFLALLGLINH